MERQKFISICLIDSNVEFEKHTLRKNIYRFRLVGVPPDQAIRLIKVDPNLSIAEIKRLVQRVYKLNPILRIQFIFKGRILPDQLKFEKIENHPKKSTITIMSTQGAGAKRTDNWKKRREMIKFER